MPANYFLFTDASVNPQSKTGYGACLLLSDLDIPVDEAKKWLELKSFENTSSSKLELQTLLWALAKIKRGVSVTIYTDSQNIIGLPGRRSRFEKNNYISKNGKKIRNDLLYQEFYKLTDKISCTFVKLKGHKTSSEKDKVDSLFTIVDRASRNALRTNIAL
ncbi:ribonuclease HI [Marinifilum sp. RC60d5]|uniref:ribonuclease HI n=1 Tax=Marinifilum sp. RC60d5 TaxID=3458414 RepID=UPI004036C7B7